MTGILNGKVALVTGGGSGIGEACARNLAEAGAAVMVADLAFESAQALARQLGGGAHAVQVDVSQEESCREMVAATLERFGNLDIAVNNAGIGNADRSLVADLPFDAWRAVLGVNLDGVFLSMKAEIPAMLRAGHGAIINIASVLGTVAIANASAYIASEARRGWPYQGGGARLRGSGDSHKCCWPRLCRHRDAGKPYRRAAQRNRWPTSAQPHREAGGDCCRRALFSQRRSILRHRRLLHGRRRLHCQIAFGR